MKKQFITPPSSPRPRGYHHVVASEAGRLIFTAGQVGFDRDRNLIGDGDLAVQIRHAMKNLVTKAAGGGFEDIVKLTTFVVDYDPAQREIVLDTVAEFFPPQRTPANSLIGIDSLSVNGLLVEIEAIAVTDRPMP